LSSDGGLSPQHGASFHPSDYHIFSIAEINDKSDTQRGSSNVVSADCDIVGNSTSVADEVEIRSIRDGVDALKLDASLLDQEEPYSSHSSDSSGDELSQGHDDSFVESSTNETMGARRHSRFAGSKEVPMGATPLHRRTATRNMKEINGGVQSIWSLVDATGHLMTIDWDDAHFDELFFEHFERLLTKFIEERHPNWRSYPYNGDGLKVEQSMRRERIILRSGDGNDVLSPTHRATHHPG